MSHEEAIAIRTVGLGRRYTVRRGTDVIALEALDLQVRAGEVHGLLGPNGAGKTTLCKILSTILLPTSGSAAVMGHDVVTAASEVRRSLGLVLGGDRGLYLGLTARANLEFWAAMYGMHGSAARHRIEEVIDLLGLSEVDRSVERYSRGMKQRLHLARGILPRPQVLLLDEPTIGMDPVSAVAFRDLVRQVNAEGTTILLTTHDMAEAEALCERVSLIDQGRLLITQTPRELGRQVSGFERLDIDDLDAGHARTWVERWQGRPEVASVRVLASGVVRVETRQEGALAGLLRELLEAGHTSVRVARPDLAEIYVHLIGDRGMRLR